MKRIAFTLAILSLAISSVAAADAKSYPDVKLQISFPDGWKVKDAKNGITMVGGPHDEADLIVFPVLNPTPDVVKKNVDDLITSMHASNVTWDDKLGEDKINDLAAFARKGSGTFDGKSYDLVTIVVVNDTHALVVIGLVQHDKKDTYKDVLTTTVKSIQPTK